MSRTVDIPHVEEQLTVHRSLIGALLGAIALVNLTIGDLAAGSCMLAASVWAFTRATWQYYGHILVGGALLGCAAHVALYQTMVRPAVYALGVVAVALYRSYR